jgi:signal transduction histidine kinase
VNTTGELRRIRYRLAALNLAVFALVLLITLGAAGLSAQRSAARAIDQELQAASVRVGALIEHERSERHSGRDREHDDEDDEDRERGRARTSSQTEATHVFVASEAPLIVSWGRDGELQRIDGGPPLSEPADPAGIAAALRGEASFSDRVVGRAPMRVHTLPLRFDGRVDSVLQLAKPTAESQSAVLRTQLILGATGALGLLLGALASVFLAGRAMGPIERSIARQQRFIGDASHELRTPVAVIRARAELLTAELGGAATAAGAEARQLGRDAVELSDLLSVMLELARLDAAETPLELAPTPLLDVAEEVAAQLGPLAQETALELQARGSTVFAQANLARLRQVVRALTDNALKYANTKVSLVVDEHGGRGRITISDDGPGIAAEHLPKLSERFYRVDAARGRARATADEGLERPQERSGAGLGLAIAHELVTRMGGELSLTSELGRGTTVAVLLPLAR